MGLLETILKELVQLTTSVPYPMLRCETHELTNYEGNFNKFAILLYYPILLQRL